MIEFRLTRGLLRRVLPVGALLVAFLVQHDARAQSLGFSISVDGEHVAGDPVPAQAVAAHETDVALERTDIGITFDGLGVATMLNLLPASLRSTYNAGEDVDFVLTSNYPAFIARAEIRILDPETGRLLATLPAAPNGRASWLMPAEGGPSFVFLARVYDGDGRYDETGPLLVHRMARPVEATPDRDFAAAGWGTDRTLTRNISIQGGAVTVHGRDLPPGAAVRVFGETVPVDNDGTFVIRRLLPAGDHVVDVAVGDAGAAMVFNRRVNIPTDEWFYVAMADLTVGTRWGSGRLIAADPSEFDQIYWKGRTAFYLKGKIRGEYLLTAAADTGEGPITEMLSGPLSKDPQALLRRIDPEQYYPVYGDDSVLVDDAPTHGKLYVRLERGPSNVMWGDFRTVVGDTALYRSERQLYGASAHYESDAVTANGQPRISATAYAARPGTLPERNVLRGTGGSAYVLRRQDIVPDSETVTIEQRSGVSGLVVATSVLTPDTDYAINYHQGTILLARPLNSTAPSSGAVSGAGDIVNLVVQYEYIPTDAALEDYAIGGNAGARINDHVEVGVMGLGERNDLGEHALMGGHVRVEASEETFLEAEILRSSGSAPRGWMSTDGGFTYMQGAPAGGGAPAYGYRLHGQAAMDDVLGTTFDLLAGITVEGKQAGFATPDEQITSDQTRIRAYAELATGTDSGLLLGFEHLAEATRRRTEASAELTYELTKDWRVVGGGLYFDEAGASSAEDGWRTDAGVRVIYEPSEDLAIYGFAQATLAKSPAISRNDRVGAGAQFRLSQFWTVSAEVSEGTTGLGAAALITHQPNVDEETYLGFRLTPENTVDDYYGTTAPLSGLVAGTRRRLNPALSVHAETTFGLFDDANTLAQTYGAVFTPDSLWRFTANYETGRVADDNASDFTRHALSLGAGYEHGGINWHGRGEVRLEDSLDGTRDRETYLLVSGLTLETSDDWRLLAGFDGVISRSDQGSILDGDYVEGTIGAAYRPVGHDRFNALFRYTYLYDLPGADQVLSSTGTTLGPAQRSHILSADFNYDLNQYVTLGAKYGFRIGETSATRDPADFVLNSAHLGILRADIELPLDFSLLLEQRALYQPETQMLDLGSLVALSYDVNTNARIGIGYNFGRFSDDLRDLTYDDQGIFLNLTAKY